MPRGRKPKVSGLNTGNLPAKYVKHLDATVVDEINAMDFEDLKRKIVEAENSIAEQDALSDADETLQNARGVIKDLGGGYKAAKARQTAIIKFALLCMESKGQPCEVAKKK